MVNAWGINKKEIIGLAPMDGVTDAPFRFIIAKYAKPDLMFTEFTSVEGICHGAVKIMPGFIYDLHERPIVAQLFGSTPEAFYKAAFVVAELGFDGIDINMGCPAKNIASKGAGASLIKTPALAREIITIIKRASKDWAEGRKLSEVDLPEEIVDYVKKHRPKKVEKKVLPVSVKTRIGYDNNKATDWISQLLEAKPYAISLHGRTFKQMYCGSADWDTIGKVAEMVHQTGCLILGNGDIKSVKEAYEKIKHYNVDGVLIGRAVLGNPWVLTGKEVNYKDKLKVALEHARYHQKIFGDKRYVAVRKHLGWYCRGFDNASEVRNKLMLTNNAEEVEQIVKPYII